MFGSILLVPFWFHLSSSGLDGKEGKKGKYKREVEELSKILLPFVTKPNFVAYAEKTKKGEKNTKPELIVPQKNLIQALHGYDPRLCVVKSDMKAALLTIKEKKGDAHPWNMEKENLISWSKRVTDRIALMCRHVAQAVCKGSNAPWVKLLNLPASSEKTKQETDEEEEQEEQEDEDQAEEEE